MSTSDEPSALEPPSGQPARLEGGEVRATMEQARQALEASRCEIERAQRLLRETEELAEVAVGSQREDSGDDVATN